MPSNGNATQQSCGISSAHLEVHALRLQAFGTPLLLWLSLFQDDAYDL